MSLQARFKKPPVPQTIIQFSGARLMSPEKAAEYIDRSVDLVYEMIANGKLPFVRKGRHYSLDRLDLDKWIDANKEKNTELAA